MATEIRYEKSEMESSTSTMAITTTNRTGEDIRGREVNTLKSENLNALEISINNMKSTTMDSGELMISAIKVLELVAKQLNDQKEINAQGAKVVNILLSQVDQLTKDKTELKSEIDTLKEQMEEKDEQIEEQSETISSLKEKVESHESCLNTVNTVCHAISKVSAVGAVTAGVLGAPVTGTIIGSVGLASLALTGVGGGKSTDLTSIATDAQNFFSKLSTSK